MGYEKTKLATARNCQQPSSKRLCCCCKGVRRKQPRSSRIVAVIFFCRNRVSTKSQPCAVQRRYYLVVKSLVKDLESNGIPCHYVKCAFFWFLEEADTSIWDNLNLGDCVLGAVKKLASFLKVTMLPNYFVKEKNHLKGFPRESCEVVFKEKSLRIPFQVLQTLQNSPNALSQL